MIIAKARKGEDAKEGFDFDDLSKQVIGAAIDVHRQLGPGFLESLYEQALSLEFGKRRIVFEAQREIVISYDGVPIGKHILDLVVESQLVVELKAVKALEDIHYAQLRSYLRATGMKVGLLLNFAEPTLRVKRLVNKY